MIAQALHAMRHARKVHAQFVDPTRETPINWREPSHGAHIIIEPQDDPRGRLTHSLDKVDFTPRHAAERK